MKKLYFLLFAFLITVVSFGQTPILTIISDGDCSGGNPKMIEIYADGMVDFSLYSLQRQSNGGSWGTTTNLGALGTVTDSFVYVYSDSSTIEVFATEYPSVSTVIENGVVNVNGDDGIRIILDSDMSVIDQYGVDAVDGTGQTWEYTDGYAKRVDGSGPDGGFVLSNWTYSNGALNGQGDCQGGTIFETVMGGIGVYSTTASTTPTINTNGTVSGLFYYETLGPSSSDTFTVSAINLTTDVTVDAPTNFEVSIDNINFSPSVMISHTMGTVDPTTIYVRLVAGLLENTYSDNITLSSTGAVSKMVSVSGAVGPNDPIISTSGGLSNLSYAFGSGPSASDSFTASGLFLTDDITISMVGTTDFEVSLDDTNFSASVTLSPDLNGEVTSTIIYVRLVSGLAVNSYFDDVNLSSPGAADRNIGVTGDVNPNAVCSNVGDVVITEIMQNPAGAIADGSGEWFEVYNASAGPINLKGWIISDAGADSHAITSDVIINSGEYAVLGNNANSGTNGGVMVDYEYSGVTLSNSDDEIILTCGSDVIDQVFYDGGPNFPDPSGSSMELSQSNIDATDNDTGSNWGVATSGYGSDGQFGTPGTTNDFTLSSKDIAQNSFKLFPNPTNLGYVNLSSRRNSKIDVSVFDVLGKQVLKSTVNENRLDVRSLNSGLYVLKIFQDNAVSTKRLIIQ